MPKPIVTAADMKRIIKEHPLITAGIKMADWGDVIWDRLGDLAAFTKPKLPKKRQK